MPLCSSDIGERVRERAQSLAHKSPHLQPVVSLYEAMLPLIAGADLRAAAVPLTADQIQTKMERGIPLLYGVELELDVKAARRLMIELARAVESTDASFPGALLLPWLKSSRTQGGEPAKIRRAAEENRLNVGSLLSKIVSSDGAAAETDILIPDLDAEAILMLAQHALTPALRVWCEQLSPLVGGIPWENGQCFICGAAATLGELQGNNQAKHLRCGCCGADWTFRRFQCMHCGNEDHRTKQYLYEEGMREQYNIEACDACKGYLKIISAFAPTPAELIPLEDLATVHLDCIAQERGYTRPAI